ncbi:Vsp/OspC family lipoprotein [Borrelia parkeri]|uniref:Vsp/OspC family lipoprotein n=1 Tax=Borrelia parkeri TaxID=141 RepID=UPI0032B2346D
MKRITFCALLMTLFLLMSCNNSASSPKDGQAAKSDGTLIDLKSVSSKITEAVAFAKDVKEVHTLVKSVGEFAKGIGNKVTQNTGAIAADAGGNNNGALIAGAFSIISVVSTKVEALGKKDGISAELKTQLDDVKAKSKAFLDKVKGDSELCKKDVSDDHAKKALDVNNGTKDKGAEELIALNTAVDVLLTSAKDAVTTAIKELTTPAKPSNT